MLHLLLLVYTNMYRDELLCPRAMQGDHWWSWVGFPPFVPVFHSGSAVALLSSISCWTQD